MRSLLSACAIAFLLLASPILTARNDNLGFHEDYYLGFSQGVYYGLMLAGVEYDVAWCVKAELAYEAASMGSGAEFQSKLDAIHAGCNDRISQ